jgi:hypothetical protein
MVTAAHQKPLPRPCRVSPPNCSRFLRRSRNQSRAPTPKSSAASSSSTPRNCAENTRAMDRPDRRLLGTRHRDPEPRVEEAVAEVHALLALRGHRRGGHRHIRLAGFDLIEQRRDVRHRTKLVFPALLGPRPCAQRSTLMPAQTPPAFCMTKGRRRLDDHRELLARPGLARRRLPELARKAAMQEWRNNTIERIRRVRSAMCGSIRRSRRRSTHRRGLQSPNTSMRSARPRDGISPITRAAGRSSAARRRRARSGASSSRPS